MNMKMIKLIVIHLVMEVMYTMKINKEEKYVQHQIIVQHNKIIHLENIQQVIKFAYQIVLDMYIIITKMNMYVL